MGLRVDTNADVVVVTDDVIVVLDSVSLGNDGSWDEITVEYWVYPSVDQNGARVINKNGGEADDSGKYMAGFNTNGPANVVFFGVTVGSGSYRETYDETTTVIPSGEWSHIVKVAEFCLFWVYCIQCR